MGGTLVRTNELGNKRWIRVAATAKYLAATCLSLAAISAAGINLCETHLPPSAEILAIDGSDKAIINDIASTAVSIAISSHSAVDDASDGNLLLKMPQQGGIVVGKQTVSVSVGSEIASYDVYLNAEDEDSAALVNNSADNLPSAGDLTNNIPSLDWHKGFGSPASFLPDGNAWGVALPNENDGIYNDESDYESLIARSASISDASSYRFSGVPPCSVGHLGDGNNKIIQNKSGASMTDVYYGVGIADPSSILAGDYMTSVVYTVVAELKALSINNVSPNSIRTDVNNRITLIGNNLDIVSRVTVDDRGAIKDCTDIDSDTTGTKLTCVLPAISNAGSYIINADTAGGQTVVTTIEVMPPAPTITSISPNEVNVGDGSTVMTINGSNLATTSSVYVDFNNNSRLDSGEACKVETRDDNGVTCTAPNRASASGPYTVRLTTDGGDVSKTGAVSYVVPTPTVATVSPESFLSYEDVTFEIIGENLSQVSRIDLYGFIDIWTTKGKQSCRLTSVTNTKLVCKLTNNPFNLNLWEDMTVNARFYDNNDNELLYVEKFSRITDIWGD